jgi:hypothetical protein
MNFRLEHLKVKKPHLLISLLTIHLAASLLFLPVYRLKAAALSGELLILVAVLSVVTAGCLLRDIAGALETYTRLDPRYPRNATDLNLPPIRLWQSVLALICIAGVPLILEPPTSLYVLIAFALLVPLILSSTQGPRPLARYLTALRLLMRAVELWFGHPHIDRPAVFSCGYPLVRRIQYALGIAPLLSYLAFCLKFHSFFGNDASAFIVGLFFGYTLLPILIIGAFTFPVLNDLQAVIAILEEHTRNEWEEMVDRTLSDPATAAHLFMGWSQNGIPLFLPESACRNHVYLSGPPSFNKSTEIYKLVVQLSKMTPRPSILILDPKTDLALANGILEYTRNHSIPLHLFSLQSGDETKMIQPLGCLGNNRLPVEVAQVLCNVLGLEFGGFYAKYYYSSQSQDAALATLTKYPLLPTTWQQLYDRMYNLVKRNRQRFKDAGHILTVCRSLSQYPQLNPPPGTPEDRLLNFDSIIGSGGIVLASLGSMVAPALGRVVNNLLFMNYAIAAYDRYRRGDRRQSYVCQDELQRTLSESTQQLFELMRAPGPGIICANQDVNALKADRGPDIRSTILCNTFVQMYLAVKDETLTKYLQFLSGEQLVMKKSMSEGASSGEGSTPTGGTTSSSSTSSTSYSEKEEAVLKRNEILDMNNDPLKAILHVARDCGLWQQGGRPTVIRTAWPCSAEEFDRRFNTAWPRLTEPLPKIVPVKPNVQETDGEQKEEEQENKKQREKLRRKAQEIANKKKHQAQERKKNNGRKRRKPKA